MNITSITWKSDIPLLVEACKELGIALDARTIHDLEDESERDACIKSLGLANCILLHPSYENDWDTLIEEKVDKNGA